MMIFSNPFSNNFYRLVLEWGREARWREPGSGDPGTFYMAWDLAVGKDSSVYVADARNDRIQKFDADGHFLSAWDTVQGAKEENIYWPDSVTVGDDGNVYVSTVRSEVIKFTPDGRMIWRRGRFNNDTEWLSNARSIDVSREGIVYVHDYNNRRIVCFTSDGEYFGKFYPFYNSPRYIIAGPENSVYVYDLNEASIQVFDKTGKFIDIWKRFDQSNRLHGLTVDDDYNIYAAVDDSIRKYGKDGELIDTLYKSSELGMVTGMDISPDGCLYLMCYRGILSTCINKVVKLAPAKL